MIFIVVKHPVRPEYSDDWPFPVEEFSIATRSEPGNICFDWYRSADDTNSAGFVMARLLVVARYLTRLVEWAQRGSVERTPSAVAAQRLPWSKSLARRPNFAGARIGHYITELLDPVDLRITRRLAFVSDRPERSLIVAS